MRRRNVIRMAGLYLVAGWLIVQVAETLLPVFGTPDWVLKSVIVLLALGFIPTLVFSWVYELTPQGLKRERDVVREASIVDRTARKLDIATMCLLAVVAALVVWQLSRPAVPAADASAAAPSGATAGPDAIAPGSAPAGTGLAPEGAPVAAASIAVLPFVNLSADPENEYFSDGITEEILNALTRIEGLKVAGRTSSFRFKGTNEDLKAIGAALGVAHVLEGSVRKQGDHVRITAQLIQVDDGFHVWSENFDRQLVDIFVVQDEISAAIASALSTRIMGAVRPGSDATIDPATYDLYLRARHELATRDAARIQAAADLFGEVVAAAPRFDAAWSGRAKALALVYNYSGGVADPTRYDEATAATERALALNPDNAEARVMHGFVALLRSMDVEAALADARAAIAIAPNDAEIANFAGDIFRLSGELDDAVRWEQRAVELDPLFAVQHSDLGFVLAMRRRYPEAIALGARALELDPAYWTAHDMRARAYFALGDVDAAAAEIARFAAKNPNIFLVIEHHARLALARGDEAAARRHLAVLQARADAGETIHYTIAALQVRLGDLDDAARSLQKAIDERDPALTADTEWVRAGDWPDHAAIQAQLARPEIAPIFARRARFESDGPAPGLAGANAPGTAP